MTGGRETQVQMVESRTERELRDTRDMLATVIRASPLAIIVLNRQRLVQLWNNAAEALFGWSEREVIGKPLPTIPPQHREAIEAGINASLQGESSRVTDGKRLRKDGKLVDVQGWVSPHCNASGEVIGAIGMFADATERVRSRAREQRQQEELAHVLLFHTVGEVAATLAHELNQPLGAILNFAGAALDSVRGGKLDPAMLAETLEEIVHETNRADQIIRRVRSFVRKGPSEPGAIDLNAAAEDAVKLLESRIERAGIDLRLSLDAGRPHVRGDAVHVAQIIVNLLNNAIDAVAEAPEPRRIVSVYTAGAGAGVAEVCVADQGQGVEPALIEQLFKPFYTTRADGLGMGLAISRSLAEAHGGRLHAERCDQGGMRFILTLPLAQEEGNGP